MDGELRRYDIKHDFLTDVHLFLLFVEDGIDGARAVVTRVRDDENRAEGLRLIPGSIVGEGASTHLFVSLMRLNNRGVGEIRPYIVRDILLLPFV